MAPEFREKKFEAHHRGGERGPREVDVSVVFVRDEGLVPLRRAVRRLALLRKPACQERGRFTVVGDDDQSIYSWRGADPENLTLLQQDYPQLRVIKLEHNYRSTARILRAANHLIAHNPHLFEKTIFSNFTTSNALKWFISVTLTLGIFLIDFSIFSFEDLSKIINEFKI